MSYTIRNNIVDADVDPMTRNHWKRKKKAEVDLLHGAPFVIERQLEDQKHMMEYNKNPRYFENTKVEKTRSEKLIAKKGNAAPITTKVKALNKIVREASGVYNYTLVPPPKRPDDAVDGEVWDADTHPLTKPYREASKMNPSICSFGHRPSSASRTFHPGTMRFRLHKGEIAKPGANGKTGFGLTPANLAKIIRAPRYISLEESLNIEDSKANHSSMYGASSSDPFGLFTAPPRDPDMDRPASNEEFKNDTSLSIDGTSESGRNQQRFGDTNHFTSQTSRSTVRSTKSDSGLKDKKNTKSRLLDPLPLDRPDWDDWHHRIDLEERLRGKFKLRASGLDREETALSEKLTRYAKLTTVDPKEPKMYCKEKWDLDTALYNGKITHSELGGRGTENSLYDPDQEREFIKLKRLQKKYNKELEKKHSYAIFMSELDRVPDVPYQPTVLAASINGALSSSGYDLGSQTEDDVATGGNSSTLSATLTCATVETVAKSLIRPPEKEAERGPFLDLTRPKSPWGRGPSDNYSIPRAAKHIPPSEMIQKILSPDTKIPLAKDFVFSKKRSRKSESEFPLSDAISKSKSPSKGKKLIDEDEDLLHADTTPALSAEMKAVSANLLSGEVVIDNTRRAPKSIPVIYCGPDWEKYYEDKKKYSKHLEEVEITKAAVPSVADYINSLRNRTDFEFENNNIRKKKEASASKEENKLNQQRSSEQMSDGNGDRRHGTEASESALGARKMPHPISPRDDERGLRASPEYDRYSPTHDPALADVEDFAEESHDDDKDSHPSPTRQREQEDDEENYKDRALKFDD